MHLNPNAEKHTNTCFQLMMPEIDAAWVAILCVLYLYKEI